MAAGLDAWSPLFRISATNLPGEGDFRDSDSRNKAESGALYSEEEESGTGFGKTSTVLLLIYEAGKEK